MDVLAIHRRVERTIRERRALGIKPDPRTIAEIMIDEDATDRSREDFSSEPWRPFSSTRALLHTR